MKRLPHPERGGIRIDADSVDAFVLVVDGDGVVRRCNRTVREMWGNAEGRPFNGLLMGCANACEAGMKCGFTEECRNCDLRKDLLDAPWAGERRVVAVRMRLIREEMIREFVFLAEVVPWPEGGGGTRLVIFHDCSFFSEVRTMVPVCAWCNRVRAATGEWVEMEEHFKSSLHVRITHSICPCCFDLIRGDGSSGS